MTKARLGFLSITHPISAMPMSLDDVRAAVLSLNVHDRRGKAVGFAEADFRCRRVAAVVPATAW